MYTVITDFGDSFDEQRFVTEEQVLDYYCNCLLSLCAVKPEDVKISYNDTEQIKLKVIMEKQERYE